MTVITDPLGLDHRRLGASDPENHVVKKTAHTSKISEVGEKNS